MDNNYDDPNRTQHKHNYPPMVPMSPGNYSFWDSLKNNKLYLIILVIIIVVVIWWFFIRKNDNSTTNVTNVSTTPARPPFSVSGLPRNGPSSNRMNF